MGLHEITMKLPYCIAEKKLRNLSWDIRINTIRFIAGVLQWCPTALCLNVYPSVTSGSSAQCLDLEILLAVIPPSKKFALSYSAKQG